MQCEIALQRNIKIEVTVYGITVMLRGSNETQHRSRQVYRSQMPEMWGRNLHQEICAKETCSIRRLTAGNAFSR